MKLNYRVILNVMGILLVLNGIFMLTSVPFSIYYGSEDLLPVLYSAGVTLVTGFALWFSTRKNLNKDLRKRDGYLVVASGWITMSIFGSLPYIFGGVFPSVADAFFETLSGYSTTGATVMADIESIPKGILFWRSLTQWIGGMGIIVLTVAILPFLGIGGMQLFVAEAPGISPDKLQPRIKETAKRLWLIYVALTGTEFLLLWAEGMSFYDAINHALTTMATGGFSTKNASIAAFDSPLIQYTIILFMFLAGTNFTITYLALHYDFKKIFRNEEFKTYTLVIIGLTAVVTISIISLGHGTFEGSLRDALFQVVSVITTTGYITHDYTVWTPFITVLFFCMMFLGASAGSTAGGVKIVRHLILFKNSLLELKRILHPQAVIPVRFNGNAVNRDITFNILAFIMIYISIFALGSVIMGIIGTDFDTSIGAVATCLGNIGPGLGSVGPVYNFAHIPQAGKWFLSFLMLLGRLELFTILILFTPYFWRKF